MIQAPRANPSREKTPLLLENTRRGWMCPMLENTLAYFPKGKIKLYKTVGSSDSVVEQVTQDPKFEGSNPAVVTLEKIRPEKMFYKIGSRGQSCKTFYSRNLWTFRNKLEWLSLPSLSSLV